MEAKSCINLKGSGQDIKDLVNSDNATGIKEPDLLLYPQYSFEQAHKLYYLSG